jgi:uncharacterized phiE125 gp8 family phage protein
MAMTVRPALLPDELIQQFVKPDGDAQAALLGSFRLTALGWVEQHTLRSLQRRIWVATFDAFGEVMPLRRDPVHSVVSLTYVDQAGASIDAAGMWQLSNGSIYPLGGRRWPATARRADAVVVHFDAGYDEVATEASALQVAALMMVKHLFDGGSLEDVPATVSLLLDAQYRTPVIA